MIKSSDKKINWRAISQLQKAGRLKTAISVLNDYLLENPGTNESNQIKEKISALKKDITNGKQVEFGVNKKQLKKIAKELIEGILSLALEIIVGILFLVIIAYIIKS